MAENRTYLVLGANGFIGSHIVDQLAAKENVTVRAFDRFSRDPQFIDKPNVEVYKGDIFDAESVAKALEGVDYVMHSFSATTPFISENDPYIDISQNLTTSVKIFELCVKANVKKISFISSGGVVYGLAAEKGIVHETDAPLPVSPYGINKLAIEHYLEYFKRKQGLQYVVYRLTNPYGPRQYAKNNQGVIPTFLNKVRNDEELVILGDGNASRDYIYIEDAVRMMVDTFEQPNQHNIYNIGSGQETSVNQIIDGIKSLNPDKDIRVKYTEAPKTFLTKTQVSIDRYVSEYGQPALLSLGEGLTKTVNFDK
jgi:UDP-glucose 4-epimerase